MNKIGKNNNELKLDELDKKIILMLQMDSEISTEFIANFMGISEKIIKSRILTLEQNNIIVKKYGFNFKKNGNNTKENVEDIIDYKLASVLIKTKNAIPILKKLRRCPFVVNSFCKTGEFNIISFFIGKDFEDVNKILDKCYWTDPNIKSILSDFLFNPLDDFIFKVNFNLEDYITHGCPNEVYCNKKNKKILSNLVAQSLINRDKIKSKDEENTDFMEKMNLDKHKINLLEELE
ncbi:MAG: Lrp/AsnC family transcriptional regulator [Promethearchaeota archaeon]